MLDGLDDVPWDRLHHAYGAASDVPGLLRELAAPASRRGSSVTSGLRPPTRSRISALTSTTRM